MIPPILFSGIILQGNINIVFSNQYTTILIYHDLRPSGVFASMAFISLSATCETPMHEYTCSTKRPTAGLTFLYYLTYQARLLYIGVSQAILFRAEILIGENPAETLEFACFFAQFMLCDTLHNLSENY